jgi:hypothetical protein
MPFLTMYSFFLIKKIYTFFHNLNKAQCICSINNEWLNLDKYLKSQNQEYHKSCFKMKETENCDITTMTNNECLKTLHDVPIFFDFSIQSENEFQVLNISFNYYEGFKKCKDTSNYMIKYRKKDVNNALHISSDKSWVYGYFAYLDIFIILLKNV